MSSLKNQAQPLLFLTYRSLFNGFKRALTSPRRLISLLLFVGYYFFFFVRPGLGSNPSEALPQEWIGRLDFPALAVIDAVAWTLLAVMSLFMLMGIMNANTGYKPSDVDVLFATPISPKVLLIFRIARDYLVTLITPIFIALVGLVPARTGWDMLFRDIPNGASGLTLRMLYLAYALMSLGWVMLSYSVSLFVNRSDARSDRNRRWLGYALAASVIAVVAAVGLQIRAIQEPGDLIGLSQAGWLRGFFFMATLANQMVLAPLRPEGVASAWIGVIGLVAIIVGGFSLAVSQTAWMYDQAAIKAYSRSNFQDLQRSGDLMGATAESIRQRGKGQVRASFMNRFVLTGMWALVWKEVILQTRTIWTLAIFMVLGIVLGSMPALFPETRPGQGIGSLLLFMQGTSAYLVTMNVAMSGYIEVLRRIDLQRPLPFPSWQIVLAEVTSKALLVVIPSSLSLLVVLIAKIQLWPYVLASVFFVPGFSLLLSSAVFLVTMLFPDYDDPTQRQFRVLVMMLAVIIFGFVPAGALGVLIGLVKLPIPLAGLVAGLLGVGLGALLTVFSGRLYETYNPTE